MQKIIFLILFFNLFQVFGQDVSESKYRFAKEVFKTEYQTQNYEKFQGVVQRISQNEFKFDDKVLKIFPDDTTSFSIFSKGIFHPEIIVGKTKTTVLNKSELDTMSKSKKVFHHLTRSDSLTIGNLEELEKLNPDFKTKRFLFWLFRIGVANPQECYFELRNENGTKEMKMEEFIENSKLTFYYAGTIII